MRRGSSVQPRGTPSDRNPLAVAVSSSTGSQAPGTDIGAVYTVPAGRRFTLTNILVYLDRVTAATVLGEVSGRLEVSIASGAFAPLIYTSFNNNTVGVTAGQASSPQLTMSAGDRVRWVTFDGSTNGTCLRIASYAGTEFDA